MTDESPNDGAPGDGAPDDGAPDDGAMDDRSANDGAVPASAIFPGGIGVSHLRVYTSTAPDGLAGGTPHLHTACSEAYWVVAGRGRVQTITAADGFGETTLTPGTVAWFSPGTIHRLVNDSGDLEILVLMANSGLPEAGDMVVVQSPEVIAAPEAARRAAELPAGARTTDGDHDPARLRRDAAVEAFNAIRADLETGDGHLLEDFLDHATASVSAHTSHWRRCWAVGAGAAAAVTDAHLRALAAGDGTHLRAAAIHHRTPSSGPRRLGCCGTLGTIITPEEVTVP